MSRLRNFVFRKRYKSELDEEIEQHLAEHTATLEANGLAPREARRQARLKFGNSTFLAERSMEVWQLAWLESVWRDLRFAFFQLLKSPVYTVTAILTLAIGVGSNAAIFSLIDEVVLRSLPVSRPGDLVSVGYRSPVFRTDFVPFQSLSTLDYLQHHVVNLEGIAGWGESMLSIADDRGTLRSLAGNLVTGNALSLLGVRPILGRLLTPADDVAGGPAGGWPVVLDYGFWQGNFHGDPGVIGRPLKISSHSAVIVGILPANFTGIFVGQRACVYMPAHFLSELASNPIDDPYQHHEYLSFSTIGRLKSGSTLNMLNAELAVDSSAVIHGLLPPNLLRNPGWQKAILAAASSRHGFSTFLEAQYSQPLFILQAIAMAVLLLCCVNMGAVQLARVEARQHEFAVRTALGAGRRRILQQCLVESLLLAVVGSLLAATLAWASTGVLGEYLTPAGSGDATFLRPSLSLFLFTSLLALGTTIFFGLGPALIASLSAPASLLAAKGSTRRHATHRQRILVPAQFAIALVLVFSAGLFSRTLIHLRHERIGFEPDHVMEVCAQFQNLKKSPSEITDLYRKMVTSLRASPGIQAAAYTWVTPLTDFAPEVIVHSTARAEVDHTMAFNEVSDDYFKTSGTHLLAGREFNENDKERSTCVLNQSANRLLFPGAFALGDTLKAEYKRGAWNATCRVVGIVEDAQYATLRAPAPPTLYFSAGVLTIDKGGFNDNLVFFIKSQNDQDSITAYRAALASLAPETSYMTFLPLRVQLEQSLGSERLLTVITNTFAAIALLLSGVGLFGVLALRVHQRTPELGIRMAMGASRTNLLFMLLRDAGVMILYGLALGSILSLITGYLIRKMLFATSTMEPQVAAISLATVLFIGLNAALIPAIRAARSSPMRALRAQ